MVLCALYDDKKIFFPLFGTLCTIIFLVFLLKWGKLSGLNKIQSENRFECIVQNYLEHK